MRKESGRISLYENIDRKKFAERLKQLISSRYDTQRQFANELGVSDNTVSNWVNGTNMPQTDTIHLIAKVLEVNIDYILVGDRVKFDDTFPNGTDRGFISEEEYETLARAACTEPRLLLEDAVLFFPFFKVEELCDVISRVMDCNLPDYVNRFFRKKVDVLEREPAGRFAIRILKHRGCPFVDGICLADDQSTIEEEAYFYCRYVEKWKEKMKNIAVYYKAAGCQTDW